MAAEDLTYRQRLFVEAYLGKANGNATEAARQAGYAWPDRQGTQQLAKSSVRAAISLRAAEAGMDANEVLGRLSDLARADMSDFLKVDKDGGYKIDLNKAKRRNKLSLIKKLTPTKFGLGIELHDPMAALDRMAKYHGLMDRIDLSHAEDEALAPGAPGDQGEGADPPPEAG